MSSARLDDVTDDGPIHRQLEMIVSVDTPDDEMAPRDLGRLLERALTEQLDEEWAISAETAERLSRNPNTGRDVYRVTFVAVLGSRLDSTAPINLPGFTSLPFDNP